MPATYSVTDARSALHEILDRVFAGEEIVISRHGVPVAVLVRPDALRVRRAEAALAVARSVLDAVAAPISDTPPQGTTRRAAEAHVKALRSERAQR